MFCCFTLKDILPFFIELFLSSIILVGAIWFTRVDLLDYLLSILDFLESILSNNWFKHLLKPSKIRICIMTNTFKKNTSIFNQKLWKFHFLWPFTALIHLERHIVKAFINCQSRDFLLNSISYRDWDIGSERYLNCWGNLNKFLK